VSIKRKINNRQLQDLLQTTALLAKDVAQVRLAGWVTWLTIDDVWRSGCVWDWVLEAALSVGSANYANIQLVHPRLPGLELIAQRGFQRPFLEFFRFVADHHSACGMALKRQRPVLVNDVANSPIFAHTPQLEVILDAGVRAVKSFPLISCKGQTLGMLSVHYAQPNGERLGETARLKMLARTIALAMERNGATPRRPLAALRHAKNDNGFECARELQATANTRSANQLISTGETRGETD
jgi:GAF domain-containing protein